MKLSVIIPVYNEKNSIEEIVKRVHATGLADEIILVDDGSIDGTRDILPTLDGKTAYASSCMRRIRARVAPCVQA